MTTNRDARETSTYLAWQSNLGIAVQIARLRESFVSGQQGAGVQLVDASGLILALWRLRLAAVMSQQIDEPSDLVSSALAVFDSQLSDLAKLRHVTMHFDEYALETDRRRNTVGQPARLIEALDLWRMRSLPGGFEWLDVRVDYAEVEHAARVLYDAVQVTNNAQLG